MEIISFLFDFILHIDAHLGEIITSYGTATYAILFFIVFIETGFVVTPFLPGDSLLFAVGAFAALGLVNIWGVIFLLVVAAVAGDAVNYWIGHFFGQKIVDNPKIPFVNQKHIDQTQAFYKKHGGKTIFLARFIPIIRTFAPFVAGVGKMHYRKFLVFNLTGGVVWVFSFSLAGFFFGNIPIVKNNFSLTILGIILVSVLPMAYHAARERLNKKRGNEKKSKV